MSVDQKLAKASVAAAVEAAVPVAAAIRHVRFNMSSPMEEATKAFEMAMTKVIDAEEKMVTAPTMEAQMAVWAKVSTMVMHHALNAVTAASVPPHMVPAWMKREVQKAQEAKTAADVAGALYEAVRQVKKTGTVPSDRYRRRCCGRLEW
jgi:hypothetical protein